MIFYNVFPMKKKAVIIIIVIVIVILIGVAVYLFVKGGKDKNGKKDSKKDTDTDDGGITPPIGTIPSGTIPSGGGTTQVVASFPLKKGSKGTNVEALQRALASNPCLTQLNVNKVTVPTADGNFGPITEKALKTCFNVTSVSETMYNNIIAGSQAVYVAPVVGSAIKVGDRLKATGYTPIFEDAALTKPLKTKSASGDTTGAWYFSKGENVGQVQAIQGRGLKVTKITNAPGCPVDCRYNYYVDKFYTYTKF